MSEENEGYIITIETADAKCSWCGNHTRCGYFTEVEAWICAVCIQKVTGSYPRRAGSKDEVR